MCRWSEAYWCYFLVLIFLLTWNFFYQEYNTLGNNYYHVNHTDIDCVDITMYSKVANGLGHSYKLTKILPKLTNIFLIDKIAGLKVYRFYSFQEI